ncbi:hypothetical protein QYE76_033022 [Lolium multiflorum]|uniref:RNase H type-1 domain-containing protein n=1 Tax=Lolium multiflorum TaxID=4521 RepID=A0AAD8VJX8_LOLMU|nr:hypothetical protein QYE76_033022 [Lolium multiflorum]
MGRPIRLSLKRSNVDAAVRENNGEGVVGAIARSAQGEFMGASSLVFPSSNDPDTLEMLPCREACALPRDLSLRSVRVATNCSNAVRSLERGTMGAYAHIVQEIVQVKKNFQELVFVHEGWSLNKEAHALARSAIYDEPGRCWLLDYTSYGQRKFFQHKEKIIFFTKDIVDKLFGFPLGTKPFVMDSSDPDIIIEVEQLLAQYKQGRKTIPVKIRDISLTPYGTPIQILLDAPQARDGDAVLQVVANDLIDHPPEPNQAILGELFVDDFNEDGYYNQEGAKPAVALVAEGEYH